jgi:hypothetical protein
MAAYKFSGKAETSGLRQMLHQPRYSTKMVIGSESSRYLPPSQNVDWLRVFEVPVPILGWALGTGRTHMMQVAAHLVLFAAFQFLAFVP